MRNITAAGGDDPASNADANAWRRIVSSVPLSNPGDTATLACSVNAGRTIADTRTPRRTRRSRSNSRTAKMTRHRAGWITQRSGRFFVGSALQITKDQHITILSRQMIQLLVQQGTGVLVLFSTPRRFGELHRCSTSHSVLVGLLTPQPPSDAASRAVQKTGHRLTAADRSSTASQHQERCLKRILGIVAIAQQPATNAKDERCVTPQQRIKGGLVALFQIAVQQLVVGQVGGGWIVYAVKPTSQCGAEMPVTHDAFSQLRQLLLENSASKVSRKSRFRRRAA